MTYKIITIDGASATGKGTVAKLLASATGWHYFDTGAMYRAFAYHFHHQAFDKAQLPKAIKSFSFSIQEYHGHKHYYVGEQEVTKAIRSLKIASLASKLSKYPEVREELVALQRKLGSEKPSIFEGRDVGSVVFPEAPLKIFLVAEERVRAQRRLKELKDTDYETVLEELKKRDERDINRTHSPLVKSQGAIEIDTSDKSPEEVVELILSHGQKLRLF